MANILKKIEKIGKHIEEQVNDIIHPIIEQTYQSPLECVGICRREVLKPLRYYGKQYPYAMPVEVDYIKTNNSYVAASGWRPSTYELRTEIQDKEFQRVAKEFDVQY